MTASDDDWDWEFTDPAEREFEKLQPHEQERNISKLDEIANDRWRDPSFGVAERSVTGLGPPQQSFRMAQTRQVRNRPGTLPAKG